MHRNGLVQHSGKPATPADFKKENPSGNTPNIRTKLLFVQTQRLGDNVTST
jgi:hypothetical protein